MMAESNGIESSSVQVRPVCRTEDNAEDAQPYKRQKSERLESVLHLGSLNGAEDSQLQRTSVKGFDDVDGIQSVGEFVEDILRAATPDSLWPQIGPTPKDEEVLENNLQIKDPDHGTEGIPLGLHVKEHERGYRIHQILHNKFRETNALREGDIITSVGERNVRELPIEDVKKIFWDLDFDVPLKLVILRKPEESGDETDSGGTRSDYRLTTVSLHLQKENNEITFTTRVTNVSSGSFLTYAPLPGKYYVYVKEPGGTNELYLGVQDGQPKMMIMGTNRSNFYWRKQVTINAEGNISFQILLHNQTGKTLCWDLDIPEGSQDPVLAKMSNEGFLPEGTRTEPDIRWVIKELIGEADDAFYMKSAEHISFYMGVSEEAGTMGHVRFARDTNQHPKRRIHIENI